ncbi:MAG: hypothetical protein R2838_05445 [Caldilineaceae bacterium]
MRTVSSVRQTQLVDGGEEGLVQRFRLIAAAGGEFGQGALELGQLSVKSKLRTTNSSPWSR